MSCWGGGGPRERACLDIAAGSPLVGEDACVAPSITMLDEALRCGVHSTVSLAGAPVSGHSLLTCVPGAQHVNLRSLVPPQRLAQGARAPGTRGAVQ